METGISPEITKLRTQVQALAELNTRLHQLRNVPTWLLRSPNSVFPLGPIRAEFQTLKELGDGLCSETVQEALRSAKESEEEDKSELRFDSRPENRRRKRTPSPDSPKTYTTSQPKSLSLFPSTKETQDALRLDGLPDFIRQFNGSHRCKLHIWTPTRSGKGKLNNPVTVHFAIPDILVAYFSIAYEGTGRLVVESVTASGPREETKPHCQSNYTVYQKLSQQTAKMIQSHPTVSFQELMNLMLSYEGLFVDRCSNCLRVLSLEGHIPPVARVWIAAHSDSESGKWEPRHITCLHS